jgi:hypothetical protein
VWTVSLPILFAEISETNNRVPAIAFLPSVRTLQQAAFAIPARPVANPSRASG